MAQSFHIEKIKLDKYKIMILSTDSLRIHDYLIDVVKELKKIYFKGDVLFDLLLSNGPSLGGRFYSAFFDGKNFDISSFKNIKIVNTEVEKTSNCFYETHLNLIDDSILTKQQKFILKKKFKKIIQVISKT